jgi:hypothetical protein
MSYDEYNDFNPYVNPDKLVEANLQLIAKKTNTEYDTVKLIMQEHFELYIREFEETLKDYTKT